MEARLAGGRGVCLLDLTPFPPVEAGSMNNTRSKRQSSESPGVPIVALRGEDTRRSFGAVPSVQVSFWVLTVQLERLLDLLEKQGGK